MTLLRTKDGIQNMKLIRTIDGKLNCITQTVWDPTKILSDLKLKTVKWDPKKKSIKNSHSCSNKCQTVSPKQYLKGPQKGNYMGHQATTAP